MAEYKSFHYQMHQVPEPIKPHYIQAPKALRFSELYSPRNDLTISMGKHERSFWRTRDRIEFEIYENRKNEVVFITCHNLDNQEVYRTIFLHADVLYFEVEAKAREDGSREKILRKRDKIFYSDELLFKAVCDYILTRLNITTDLHTWPDFVVPEPVDNAATKPSTPNPHDLELHELTFTPVEPAGPQEKMVIFSKVFSDKYLFLEINKPEGLSLADIPYVKTAPGALPVVAPSPVKPAVPEVVASVAAAPTDASAPPVDTTTPSSLPTVTTAVTPSSGKASKAASKGVTTLPLISSGTKSGTATGTATPVAGSLPSTARMNMGVDIPLLVIPGSSSNSGTPHSTPSAAAHKTASASTAASPAGVAHTHSGSAHTTPMGTKKITPSGKSAPLARGRSSVLVKHNVTPVSSKSASTTNLTPANAAAVAAMATAGTGANSASTGMLVPPPISTSAGAAAAPAQGATVVSPSGVEVKITGTPANTPAHATTTTAATSSSSSTAALDHTVPSAEKKKTAPSPMNARHSIIGNRSQNKVVPT